MGKTSEDEGWWRFLAATNACESAKALDSFFELFLTIEERNAIGGRYLLVQELLQGERTQREIAEHLGVSIAKITRGSNSLKVIGKELRAHLLAH